MTVDALALRRVAGSDLDDFFEHQRDPRARWTAAFGAADPDNRASFDAHWTALLGHPEVASGTFHGLLEELLPDDPALDPVFASYLSVESVVSGGTVSHVAVTGRFPLASGFRETGNFIPASVPEDGIDALTAMADRVVAALGVVDSVVHTEIKLTPDGPRLIEVNGRLGGRPPLVLLEVSDVNLFQVSCAVACGTPVRFDGLVSCDGVGFRLMLQPPDAARRVASIDGLLDLADLPGVRQTVTTRAPGEAVDAREGTDGKVLTVQGRVPDHGALAATVRAIGATVSIRYD